MKNVNLKYEAPLTRGQKIYRTVFCGLALLAIIMIPWALWIFKH